MVPIQVCLVFPRFRYASGDPPLGISYLAAAIRHRFPAVKVDCLDPTFAAQPLEFCREQLSARRYDIIGISLMTSMLDDALTVARIARRYSSGALILFGGPHPTVLPEETLAHDCVDAVCIGAGEDVLGDLVAAGGDPAGIAGLWYRRNGEIIRSGPRPPRTEIDSLPYPARDLLPMQRYIRDWFQMESVGSHLRGTAVLATRGCPYRCTFCQPTLDRLFGKRILRRSPNNIISELRHLRDEYGCNAFQFVDDNLTVDLDWCRLLSAEMLRADLGMVWACTMRANYIDRPGMDQALAQMHMAGLRKVFIGFESASQRVLSAIYDKKITLDQMNRVVPLVRKHGIKVQGFFILGAPGETRREMEETIDWSVRSSLDEAAYNICTPLPGTYLYERFQGMIARPVNQLDYYRVYAFDPRQTFLTEREVVRFQRRAILRFYLAPRRIPATLRTVLRVRKTMLKLKRLF